MMFAKPIPPNHIAYSLSFSLSLSSYFCKLLGLKFVKHPTNKKRMQTDEICMRVLFVVCVYWTEATHSNNNDISGGGGTEFLVPLKRDIVVKPYVCMAA